MRFFMFDQYNTWSDWRLTLTGKDVTDPEPKTNYVSLDGRDGDIDLTEALTGEVTYQARTVTASFWCSEGTPQERVALLNRIIATLHGKQVKVVEPDDPDHYFLGRVKIKGKKQDAVHIEFTTEARCDPWRYAINETERKVQVTGQTDVVLHNNGVKSLCPVLTVQGAVNLTLNGTTVELTTGSYKVAALRLMQGINVVSLSGEGSITFTYREASL